MQKKRISVLIVLLTLMMAGCSGTGTPTIASTTPTLDQASDVVFKTPEEAINYYFEGLAQNDISKIMQASAVKEMGENFKFDLYADRLGGVMPVITSLSPTDYPLYVETNKLQLSSQLMNRVKLFTYGLLSGEKLDSSTAIIQMDAARANSFMKEVDPKRLASLKVEKVGFPNKTLMNDAKYLESATKTARVYGADESTERVVLFSFEQNYYALGFTLLRYGANWKISSQTSALANTNTLGVPGKTTLGEFESMFSGN